MIAKWGFAVVACAALTACGGRDEPPGVAYGPVASDWRQVATSADRDRLRNWRAAWMAGLNKARAAGNGAAIKAQGALFDPDRALAKALPPPGNYRCRIFKLGANGTAMRDYTAYPWFDCRIEAQGDVSSFYKTAGSQRPVGLAFRDGDARSVFLGTMMIGDEIKALDYGRDKDRDMAGIIERIGDKRWRLVLPYPRFESLLDVVEIIPA